jgi:hypothetical protein
MALPGALFIVIFLFLPIVSIVVFSFWRTEVFEIYPDWNLDNYRVLLTEGTYLVFLSRSFVTALLVSLACLLYGWPVAYFIARYGGRYRLLMILALAAPFFTGVILRVSALQGIMGPVGALNMTLMTFGIPPIEIIMFSRVATGIGLGYLYLPFMVTAIAAQFRLRAPRSRQGERRQTLAGVPGDHLAAQLDRDRDRSGAGLRAEHGRLDHADFPRRRERRLIRFGPRQAVRRDRHLGARLRHGGRPLRGVLGHHPDHVAQRRPAAQRLYREGGVR